MQNFKSSKTKENLMRAFAGESQARNRYDLAAQQAKKSQLYAVSSLFKFTAKQEQQHAKVFYDHLKDEAGETIHIQGGYPVDISDKIPDLLAMASHNEYEEHSTVYPDFARIAREESFSKISQDFENIAKIEKSHGDRFETFRSLMEQNKLFKSENTETWVCLNCGYILEGTQAPESCPVCSSPQGYFIRLEQASWGLEKN